MFILMMSLCAEVIIKETDNLSSIIDLLERELSDLYYLQENKNH